MSQSLLKNLFAKGVLNIFNILIPVLIIPYVYRVLSPETVGTIEYGTTLYTYFGLLGLLGIYNYGLREISRNKNNDNKIYRIYRELFYVGLLSNLLVFVIYEIIVYFYVEQTNLRYIMYILGFNLIAQIFYIEWINEAFEDFRFITIKTVIIRLISVTAIFIFVKDSNNYLFYVFILVVTLFLNNVISFIRARKHIYIDEIISLKELSIKKYLVPLLLILILNNTNVLYTMADRTMLGGHSGSESVAYYSIGQKLAEAIKILLLSIVYVTLPRLSLYLETNREMYIVRIQKLIKLMLLLVLPFSIGLFMLSEQVVLLFAGEQYLEAVPCFQIFALRIIVLSIESILYNQIIFLHRKEKVLLYFNLCCGGLNIGLNLILWNVLTPFMAIVTTVLCEILFQILCLIYIKKQLHISTLIFEKMNFVYLILSLLFIPIILILKYYLIGNQYLFVFSSVVLCSVVYISGLYLRRDKLFNEVLYRISNR